MFEINLNANPYPDLAIKGRFEARSGEVTVLMGKSGAGKSTILQLIAGLVPLEKGYIKEGGRDWSQKPPHQRGFGLVRQDSLLFPHLTIYENLIYGGRRGNLEELIEVFELEPHLDKKPGGLSGGEAQRAAIVRTLMSQPRLLLLDEAFNALNDQLRRKIRDYLKTSVNVPIILVTHDREEAETLGDRILEVDRGQISPQSQKGGGKDRMSAAVLAGGQSRRMGRDKALLEYEQQSFLQRALDRFDGFGELLISAASPEKYASFGQVVPDRHPQIGPLGGIYSTLKACRYPWLFICAADMPLVPRGLLDFMKTYLATDFDAVVIRDEGRVHPLLGIYNKSCLPLMETMIQEGNYRMMALLAGLRVKYLTLEHTRYPSNCLKNVNTLKDFQTLKSPRHLCISGTKNTGKTTLICKLIQAFPDKKIAVIKHDGHEFQMDHPGTDTYRFTESGAKSVVIFSDSQMAFLNQGAAKDPEAYLSFVGSADLVFFEGLKHSKLPKVELVGRAPVCDPETVLAYVTDGDFTHEEIPVLGRDAVEDLARLISREILNESR